jgi:hypothetical protein
MTMAGSGPAPNPTSRRQAGTSQANTWTDLPAAGYIGPIPEWPFSGSKARELEVWSQIWRTPQAAAWITLGWTFDIALYVRWQVAASESEAATLTEALKAGNEARQWSDRLGLNPTAMLKNRWRVRSDEVTEKRAEKTTAAKTKARRRLKVADDAVAGS